MEPEPNPESRRACNNDRGDDEQPPRRAAALAGLWINQLFGLLRLHARSLAEMRENPGSARLAADWLPIGFRWVANYSPFDRRLIALTMRSASSARST
jgi:hypothetical protein